MKKDTKKVTKTSKKKVEPKFIVDLTEIKDPKDVYVRFALAKQGAGLPITDQEFKAVINKVIDITEKVLAEEFALTATRIELQPGEKVVFGDNGKVKIKKPNIFKRFWNWITGK